MKVYTLNGHEAVPTEDTAAWGKMMNGRERIVKQEYVNGIFVSTVFLGLDHQYGDGPPLLFETMCRHPNGNWEEQERCTTWPQALVQHRRMVIQMMNKGDRNAVI